MARRPRVWFDRAATALRESERARRAVLLLIALAAAVLLLTFVIWILPNLLTKEHSGMSTKDLLAARNDIRVTLLQALAASVLGVGVVFTARTYSLSRQGQITDRYAKAIEQLGHSSLDVRLGGVFALERLSKDSEEDFFTIVEVLSAFVREHTSEWDERDRKALDVPATQDVQAAMTVLARRQSKGEIVDLDYAGLNGIRSLNGEWAGVRMQGCSLRNALFRGANLEGANFCYADISGGFGEIRARRALFIRASVTGFFFGADLRDARFANANLRHADFTGRYAYEGGPMRFAPALLDGADMTDANLEGARLQGVNLSSVRGLTKAQLELAETDDTTVLPTFLPEWSDDA